MYGEKYIELYALNVTKIMVESQLLMSDRKAPHRILIDLSDDSGG